VTDVESWYKLDGATDDEINLLRNSISFKLPDLLLTFLKFSNGGEGELSVQPYNFVLDSINEIIETNSSGEIKDNYPNFMIIGGDGGGEYIALDVVTNEIVSLDMCNSDIAESRVVVASTIEQFFSLCGFDNSDT